MFRILGIGILCQQENFRSYILDSDFIIYPIKSYDELVSSYHYKYVHALKNMHEHALCILFFKI